MCSIHSGTPDIHAPSSTIIFNGRIFDRSISEALPYYLLMWNLFLMNYFGSCTLAVAGKFKKWSKNLGSVLKRCVYDVRTEKFQKKFGLNWRFPWRAPAKTCSLVFGSAICPLQVICKAICGPKKFHPVCLTFDPLGLQMTTIAQNDQNLLSI